MVTNLDLFLFLLPFYLRIIINIFENSRPIPDMVWFALVLRCLMYWSSVLWSGFDVKNAFNVDFLLFFCHLV